MKYSQNNVLVKIASLVNITTPAVKKAIEQAFQINTTMESSAVGVTTDKPKDFGLPVKTVEVKVMKDGKEVKELKETAQPVYHLTLITTKEGYWERNSIVDHLVTHGILINKNETSFKIDYTPVV